MSIELLHRRLEKQPWCRTSTSLEPHYTTPDGAGAGTGTSSSAFLGKGTFAEVYRCVSAADGREYAVKTLKKRSLVANPVRTRHVLVEVAASALLQHPSLVRTKEVVLTKESIHLVMHLCRGVTLQEMLDTPAVLNARRSATEQHPALRSMPPLDVGRVLAQVLGALEHLHAHALVHRDVKPANVVVDPQTLHATLIDIGLGKHVGTSRSFSLASSLLYSPMEQPRFGGGAGAGGLAASTSSSSGIHLRTPQASPMQLPAGVPVSAAAHLNPELLPLSRCGSSSGGLCRTLSESCVLATPDAGTTSFLAVEGLAGKLESDQFDLEGWESRRRDLFKLDIYAVGVTAFRMLTGRLPYLQSSPSQLRRIMKVSPVRLPADPAFAAFPTMVALVEAMQAHTPAARPTATECLQDPWLAGAARVQEREDAERGGAVSVDGDGGCCSGGGGGGGGGYVAPFGHGRSCDSSSEGGGLSHDDVLGAVKEEDEEAAAEAEAAAAEALPVATSGQFLLDTTGGAAGGFGQRMGSCGEQECLQQGISSEMGTPI